ncbi:LysR substrate-binding domain-containing protein [Janthinobacterium agaricidamnosum]|uniref:Bacterial regulatory helix-turn-helix, lysR family protein n=1 Tax=Janthinobacterium agaricidamnosum NBRC 102515 = DSM 9628 TaxID=1349767 RepID=W0VF79_9BURK|nr:LysR substrate-binding domain-containing protein [Janthinobacterium agaricidamnosum]CDG86002.1 bacterial regulatory helix-turn-helix, lysR family protein [Janthinobacterium agaricidamnosum NBRC 102515 = DSM 9628]
MLDLELLNTLVCVIEEGSFTRAGERVHRTQSTVSQQIRKLEQNLGRTLLLRDKSGSHVTPTEHGELLVAYARSLLALAQEAEEALSVQLPLMPVRLGIPEDFDAATISELLSGFMRLEPGVRLATVSGMSTDLRRKMTDGELDIALVKREPGSGDAVAHWPEPLVWAAGAHTALPDGAVPLALFPQGCVYRARAIRTLDKAGRRWRVAFGSHSLMGIQAAVAAGLGISVLPASALLPGHRVLGAADGFPELAPTELALLKAPAPPGAAQRKLLDYLGQAITQVIAARARHTAA